MAAEIYLKDGSMLTVEESCSEIAKIDDQNVEKSRIYTFLNLVDHFSGLDILVPKLYIKYIKDVKK